MSREKIKKTAVLAVDGGNSKTDLALVAADGTLLATARAPGCSHQRVGLAGAMRALHEGMSMLRTAAGLPDNEPLAEIGVFCLAGVDLPVDQHIIGTALRGEGMSQTVMLFNDMLAVLWAGSQERWGIAVGAGTGLNCVGIAPDGRQLRFPALGQISGDWVAGGRWLGVRALGEAVRARDGRGPSTSLEHAVPEYYGLPDPMAVAESVYIGQIEERQLLHLAPTVFAEAARGDAVARGLLDQLTQEIVTYVGAAVRQLDLAALDVPIVLGGGLFRSGDEAFLSRVERGVLDLVPRARLQILDAPPVLGAALMGLAELRAEPDAAHNISSALAYPERTGGVR